MARQFKRSRHAHRATAGDHHAVARLWSVLRGQPGLVNLVVEIDRAAWLGGGAVHLGLLSLGPAVRASDRLGGSLVRNRAVDVTKWRHHEGEASNQPTSSLCPETASLR